LSISSNGSMVLRMFWELVESSQSLAEVAASREEYSLVTVGIESES